MKAKDFDDILNSNDAVGLKSIEQLEPVLGAGETIFPPTYADVGYQINRNPTNGDSVVVIDSVGSQANRTEPIFKDKPYSALVPQIHVILGSRRVNLLDIGHRGADAAIRLTELGTKLNEAFESLERDRDGVQLAKIAPTSLIFGAWDSRGTQAKARRVVRHTIEGSEVFELKRSAQYTPAVDYVAEGLVTEKEIKTKSGAKNVGAKVGMLDNPAPGGLGGVRVKEIRRLGLLNLNVIRNIKGSTPESTASLQRYLFGLALVAFVCPAELDLREGCELVRKIDEEPTIVLRRISSAESLTPTPEAVLNYAQATAREFGVGENREVEFDKKLAKEALKTVGKEKD
ncbi:MAG: type I-U CRISPR-associated RAMP protein Csb1/Cas7u [Planctomycetota bacterium]